MPCVVKINLTLKLWYHGYYCNYITQEKWLKTFEGPADICVCCVKLLFSCQHWNTVKSLFWLYCLVCWNRLLSRCEKATFGTVETIWKHCSCFFNFRDFVSSINQLLNQMCEDGYSEEVRPVNLLLLSYWRFTARSDSRLAGWSEHTADYMLQRVGTGKWENDTEPWTHKIQGFLADM